MITQNDELEVLRRTNGELVAKNTTRKQRIAKLEASNAELQLQLTAANGTIHEFTIGAPLKAMADRMSQVPELWLEQFAKHYKVEMIDGVLTLLSAADGTPIQKQGKPVPFETKALAELLTAGEDATAKAFRAITITSKASGGGMSAVQRREPAVAKPNKVKFGLR